MSSKSPQRDSAPKEEKRGRSRSRSASPARSSSAAKHNQEENGKPSNCIGVFGLSSRTTEGDLREEFSKYGRVQKVDLIYDKKVNLRI